MITRVLSSLPFTRHDPRPVECLSPAVNGRESRVQRSEEDVTAIVTTVVEIRDDVRWLKHAVQALLTHQGLTVATDETED